MLRVENIKIYEKNEGYKDLVVWVREAFRPRDLRPYLDGDGAPTDDVVERVRWVIDDDGADVSRRRRWMAAVVWQRTQGPEPGPEWRTRLRPPGSRR